MRLAEGRVPLAVSVAITAVLAVGIGALSGPHAAVIVSAVVLPVGALSVLLTTAVVAGERAQAGLARQFVLVAVISLGQMLVSLSLFVGVMFLTSLDALLTALVAISAGVLAGAVAQTFAQRTLHDLERVHGALDAVGAGERTLHIGPLGSAELTRLGEAVAAMAAHVGAEETARAGAEAAHRDLLASVSHDLRTPITNLRLLCDAVSDGVVGEDAHDDYVRRIGFHVRTLGALIDDLFELSRLQAGQVRWTMEQVPLDQLLEETVDAMRPEAEASAISMRTELPDHAPAARANPEQIQRVLFNLIQNAIRHTPSDGSVCVRAVSLPGTVQIEVADSGTGVPRDERERVFEPFVQGAEHAARGGGHAGLGLAIARAIVEAHGGRIWMAEASAGTLVRFTLPAAA